MALALSIHNKQKLPRKPIHHPANMVGDRHGAQGVDGLRSAVIPHCSAVVATDVDTVSYTAAALRCVAGPAAAATGALSRWPPFRGPVSPCSPLAIACLLLSSLPCLCSLSRRPRSASATCCSAYWLRWLLSLCFYIFSYMCFILHVFSIHVSWLTLIENTLSPVLLPCRHGIFCPVFLSLFIATACSCPAPFHFPASFALGVSYFFFYGIL